MHEVAGRSEGTAGGVITPVKPEPLAKISPINFAGNSAEYGFSLRPDSTRLRHRVAGNQNKHSKFAIGRTSAAASKDICPQVAAESDREQNPKKEMNTLQRQPQRNNIHQRITSWAIPAALQLTGLSGTKQATIAKN